MQNIMKNWVIKNGYANQNGNLVASESWRVAHMVPVSGDAILVDGQFGYMSGRNDYNNVVCYDMDRKFLGGCFRAESGKVYDNYVITLLPNTRFISVTTNEKLFSKDQHVMLFCFRTIQHRYRLLTSTDPVVSTVIDNRQDTFRDLNGAVDRIDRKLACSEEHFC